MHEPPFAELMEALKGTHYPISTEKELREVLGKRTFGAGKGVRLAVEDIIPFVTLPVRSPSQLVKAASEARKTKVRT